MPYVPQANRVALDEIVDGLVKRLREIECKPGDCNYVVTRVVLESLKPDTGWTYHSLSDAVRTLKDAATEIERRLLGPYEDVAVRKNGDMSCFTSEAFAYVPEFQVFANLNDPDGKRRSMVKRLQEGLETQAIKRQEEGYKSPWEIKKELDSKFEMDEKNKEKFDQMCKEQADLKDEE